MEDITAPRLAGVALRQVAGDYTFSLSGGTFYDEQPGTIHLYLVNTTFVGSYTSIAALATDPANAGRVGSASLMYTGGQALELSSLSSLSTGWVWDGAAWAQIGEGNEIHSVLVAVDGAGLRSFFSLDAALVADRTAPALSTNLVQPASATDETTLRAEWSATDGGDAALGLQPAVRMWVYSAELPAGTTAAQIEAGAYPELLVGGANGVQLGGAGGSNVAGLTPGREYWLYAFARDAAGNRTLVASATQRTRDVTPPTVPAPSVALTGAPGEIRVGGFGAISDNSGLVARRSLLFGTSSNVADASRADLPDGTGDVVIRGARDLTTYYVWAQGADGSGNVGTTPGAPATPPDTTAPVVPASVLMRSSNGTSAYVTGLDGITDNSGIVTSVNVSIGLAPELAAAFASSNVAVGHPTVVFEGLTDFTRYYSWVRASDAAGNVAAVRLSVLTADDTVPYIPASISVTAAGGAITVSGLAGVSDNSGATPAVALLYGVTNDVSAATVAAVQQSYVLEGSYMLTGLVEVSTYFVWIRATDAAGNVATSGVYTVNTADTQPPVISGFASTNTASVSGASGLTGDAITALAATDSSGEHEYYATATVSDNSTALIRAFHVISERGDLTLAELMALRSDPDVATVSIPPAYGARELTRFSGLKSTKFFRSSGGKQLLRDVGQATATFHYLLAVDAAGNGAFSRTSSQAVQPIPRVTGVTAVQSGTGGATLRWSNDAGTREGFVVAYSTKPNETATSLMALPSNQRQTVTTATATAAGFATGLSGAVQYYYMYVLPLRTGAIGGLASASIRISEKTRVWYSLTPSGLPTVAPLGQSNPGNSGYTGRCNHSDVAVDSAGVVYAVFMFDTNSYSYVMRYDSVAGAWSRVGAASGFTYKAVQTRISVGKDDAPWLCYRDDSSPVGNKLVVRRFDGTEWRRRRNGGG